MAPETAAQRFRAAELHSDVLNPTLPPSYAPLIEDEAAQHLSLSLEGLRTSVAIGDLQRGANFHCAALRRFIGLKHTLPDEVRADAIHLLYTLVTADVDIMFSMRRRWCGLLCKLLRRGKHLKLTLPWRPIFDKLLEHTGTKLRMASYASRSLNQSHVSALARCAAQCRRHFPAGSSEEILTAIEPLLCPKDPQLYTGAALLSLMLPTHSSEGAVWQTRLLALWRGAGIEGCVEWELLFMLLFKRLV